MSKKKLNIGYCGLALGITGAINTIRYLKIKNDFIVIFLLGAAIFLLTYYALEAAKNKKNFIMNMKQTQNLSLFPTFLMASANIFTYINLKTVWFMVLVGHFLYSLFFYKKVLFKSNPLVSYYIPLVGIAVNIPHAHYFHMDPLGKFLLFYGTIGYIMVSCRLIFYWKNFLVSNSFSLMGILCAPLSLCIQGGLIYIENPLIIRGGMAVSLITTFIVYMIIPYVFMDSFSLGWASLTFPTSAAAMAHLKAGIFLGISKFITIGYCEVIFSFIILIIVSIGAVTDYLKKIPRFSKICNN